MYSACQLASRASRCHSAKRLIIGRRDVANDAAKLRASLIEHQEETLRHVLPVFTSQLPASYFRQVDSSLQASHLRALVALHGSGVTPSLAMNHPSQDVISFLRPGNHPGMLRAMLMELPRSKVLNSVKVFTTQNQELALNMFHFNGNGHTTLPADGYRADAILALASDLRNGKRRDDHALLQPCPEMEQPALEKFFTCCDPQFVATTSARTLLLKKRLYDHVVDTENCIATYEPWLDVEAQSTNRFTALTMAASDVVADDLLERVVAYLGNLPHNRGSDLDNPVNLDIHRLHMDLVDGPSPTSPRVALLRVLVQPWLEQPQDRTLVSAPSPRWPLVTRDLQRLKWVSERAFQLTTSQPAVPLLVAEVMDGLSTMMHGLLATQGPYTFSRERVWTLVTAEQNCHIAQAISRLLLARFDPDEPLSTTLFNSHVEELTQKIEQDADSSDASMALSAMLTAVKHVRRTNAHLKQRYSLAFRLDPALLSQPEHDQVPYGVIFVSSDVMSGFHVRFRDIARGGLRVVTPSNADLMTVETSRVYEEAYQLAYAQQLKNKDIPEGGSKGVLLIHDINFRTSDSRSAVLRKAIKAFADGVLDLTSDEPHVVARRVDLLPPHPAPVEQLYLGPDEQVLLEDIDWIVARAAERGHPTPAVFMSSKPRAGINHKEFGVTSEGVQVFLDHALDHHGLKQKDYFTIKMTGGPDGDVAGNMIKILAREYGPQARFVGIADGSGVVEDPDGLDNQELQRLADASLPIAEFNAGCLGPKGVALSADSSAGIKARNNMHMRVASDVFIPAGGRPSTINEHNWQQYLKEDGTPSASVIAEGANLFISAAARTLLSEAGCTIIKDSSCNKAGVICSSYEILAGMLLSEDEFLDIKTQVA